MRIKATYEILVPDGMSNLNIREMLLEIGNPNGLELKRFDYLEEKKAKK